MKANPYTFSHYLKRKTFSSFLPGIAGKYGTPLWCFFVNRGQAIASFGMEHKDRSIMEFHPAYKSYEQVALHGFRTFIKVNGTIYQPFFAHDDESEITHTMHIEKNVLTIVDDNKSLGLKTTVRYFIMPQESFGALVRSVSIESTQGKSLDLEVIDGMPEVLPSGLDLAAIKRMGHTARAWANVFNKDTGIPLYRVKSSTKDTETIETIQEAVFFCTIYRNTLHKDIIVDKDILFQDHSDLIVPMGFQKKGIAELLKETQCTEDKFSSAFSAISATVTPDNPLTFQSYFGYLFSEEESEKLIQKFQKSDDMEAYYERALVHARELIDTLTDSIETHTAFPMFDQLCRQMYMDNVLRGGVPEVFPHNSGHNLVYHIYTRKHGDLERDYNNFHIEAKYYSQGNGNFRDIFQNRRNDSYFYPEIGHFNVLMFLNFLQADGYNPLVVKGVTLSVTSSHDLESIARACGIPMNEGLKERLNNFTIGELLQYVSDQALIQAHDYERLLQAVLKYATTTYNAEFGEGFWIDHFSYMLDLINSYIEVYPDQWEELLYRVPVAYFQSPARVKSRKEKYVEIDKEGDTPHLMQIGAVEKSDEKMREIAARGHNYLLGDDQQTIYRGTVFEKLLCLVANKVSAIDPSNLGIEMEAGKPGWNDALNGLPGILGSGVGEMFEVLRIVDFLCAHVSPSGAVVNECIARFAQDLSEVCKAGYTPLERWDKATSLREAYREEVKDSIPSAQITLTAAQCTAILDSYKTQISQAFPILFAQERGLPPSFVVHSITDYEEVKSQGKVNFIPSRVEKRFLPVFLEAVAKSFYVLSKEDARAMWKKVRESEIYDKKLKMYRTSESLEHESYDIGRAKAFTPGWLERESVFMHMEFKYMLKLLEKGLYEEFYEDIMNVFPCFMDEQVYGRPILEASSFIASSAYPDESLHGRGFSARLSGATAEFLSMWKLMFLGKDIFSYKNKELSFALSPRLHAQFFKNDGTLSFRMFSHTKVDVYNTAKEHTYERLPQRIVCDERSFTGHSVSGEYAERIRRKEVSHIQVYYE